MGTNEACMAWISDEIGATGFGLAVAAEAKLSLDGARVVIEGARVRRAQRLLRGIRDAPC
jgi:hypothetical protein